MRHVRWSYELEAWVDWQEQKAFRWGLMNEHDGLGNRPGWLRFPLFLLAAAKVMQS